MLFFVLALSHSAITGGARRGRLRSWVTMTARMGAIDGTWEKVLTALSAQADTEEGLDRVVAVDSTNVRTHQHAAGARE